MQVTETLSDGLKREYQVTVPASDLEARVIERLGDLKDRVRINGFRPVVLRTSRRSMAAP